MGRAAVFSLACSMLQHGRSEPLNKIVLVFCFSLLIQTEGAHVELDATKTQEDYYYDGDHNIMNCNAIDCTRDKSVPTSLYQCHCDFKWQGGQYYRHRCSATNYGYIKWQDRWVDGDINKNRIWCRKCRADQTLVEFLDSSWDMLYNQCRCKAGLWSE